MTEILANCPFCGVGLTIRGGVNPYGRCDTAGCWMEQRQIAVPLHDDWQVAAWNRRSPSPDLAGVVEALRPFAKMADEVDKWMAGSKEFDRSFDANDLRRARAAFAALQEPHTP